MIPDSNSLPAEWARAFSSTRVAAASTALDELRVFADELWWLQRRPEQAGRTDLVMFRQGSARAMLPASYSARSRVHEYGGGSYCVCDAGIYFVNDRDQQIHLLDRNGCVHQITQLAHYRFADLVYDSRLHRLICVCENHRSAAVVNTLAAINASTGAMTTLASGCDFYASPRLDGSMQQLAWLCWNHPDMPWDATQLYSATLNVHGELTAITRVVAHSPAAIIQPEWSPTGVLHYLSDHSGWWNLYMHSAAGARSLYPLACEFANAPWVLGQRYYGFIDATTILCQLIDAGRQRLAILDSTHSSLTVLNSELTSINSVQCSAQLSACLGAGIAHASEVQRIDVQTKRVLPLLATQHSAIGKERFYHPQHITFTTRHKDTAYALYYPPSHAIHASTVTHKPPLIVMPHGGPTACSDSGLDLRKQYWTARGFALLDVNYSGSTGFGREYRQRLHGKWGLRDAEDCCDAALHMVKLGLADADRLIIKGSSAGGYTALCALAFHNVFKAGASYYGIGDLAALAQHTHKFEAHYLDKLVGAYPACEDIYSRRSPINAVAQLKCPVIFFQGKDDRVVPPAQSEMMYAALKHAGIATHYICFAGEGHGFRRAETITRCLRAELTFYTRVLDLPLLDEVELAMQIDNYPPR